VERSSGAQISATSEKPSSESVVQSETPISPGRKPTGERTPTGSPTRQARFQEGGPTRCSLRAALSGAVGFGTATGPLARDRQPMNEGVSVSNMGKTHIIIMWTVGADDVAEWDRIFASHGEWMKGRSPGAA
jgi:hypothetical protein